MASRRLVQLAAGLVLAQCVAANRFVHSSDFVPGREAIPDLPTNTFPGCEHFLPKLFHPHSVVAQCRRACLNLTTVINDDANKIVGVSSCVGLKNMKLMECIEAAHPASGCTFLHHDGLKGARKLPRATTTMPMPDCEKSLRSSGAPSSCKASCKTFVHNGSPTELGKEVMQHPPRDGYSLAFHIQRRMSSHCFDRRSGNDNFFSMHDAMIMTRYPVPVLFPTKLFRGCNHAYSPTNTPFINCDISCKSSVIYGPQPFAISPFTNCHFLSGEDEHLVECISKMWEESDFYRGKCAFKEQLPPIGIAPPSLELSCSNIYDIEDLGRKTVGHGTMECQAQCEYLTRYGGCPATGEDRFVCITNSPSCKNCLFDPRENAF